MSKSVLLAMSGGIDSTAAAVLLQEAGYEVTGFTFGIAYFNSDTVENAKKICDQLRIKHIYQNINDKFNREVIEYFRKEYEQGRTPNPCIKCNLNIKFGYIYDFALKSGYDKLATGHYASIMKIDGKSRLVKAKDESRDQTYFLYVLKQQQLDNIIFPLGNTLKSKAREICEKQGLLPADIGESREICFISDNYKSFLNDELGVKPVPGNFIDPQGNILGKHKGVINYTVGQRKGLGIGFGKPVYIKSIDATTGNIILTEKENIYSNQFKIINLSLINGFIPPNYDLYVKIRYGAPHAGVKTINDLGNGVFEIILKKPLKAITPGQAAVIYTKDFVVGGGTII